ncbi:TIGR04283 family arsenosugar biosynthesis glycosyltransferase [Spongiivirga citrea]|uniref:TIGR04283 family arsenosugar biosynthesis glycosyltransferase n=1 Tax=Spongiivirga citrea TaxID=1481457 RepID=UPI001EF7EE04|nr:TIGR04283 family arsenosugar biosynthesis glycosyltransferase [Spongiivirga citrea]
MKISIIIPILNEADNIVQLLEYLYENSSATNIKEILIVDGGSTDGSQEIIKRLTQEKGLDIILLHSKKGRARQMNVGAKKAKGELLYFLHADSIPPRNFDKAIIDAANDNASAGCFRMKFDNDHLVLKFSQWFTRFNLRGCRGGDQSLFIKRELFDTLNGFNEDYIIYEDSEFIGRLYDQGEFTVIPDYVTTSSRRYDANGTWRLQYHFTVIHLKKFFGASPNQLYQYYKRNIAS